MEECNDKIKFTGIAFPSVKLQLSLKTFWFEMTSLNMKNEDYRVKKKPFKRIYLRNVF